MELTQQGQRRFAGWDGFQLKLLALITMTMDHLAAYLPSGAGIPDWFHLIGRLAAPLFVFFCAEGIFYTHDRKKYMLRLYVGWVLMSLGNYLVSVWLAHPDGVIVANGMFGTMFLIVLVVSSVESIGSGWRTRSAKKIGLGLAGLFYLAASVAAQMMGYLWLMSMIDPATGTLRDAAMLPVVQQTELHPIC